MFKNEFQGGAYFEIFSAQGKDPMSNWRRSSSGINKTFDKEVRSFVFTVEGSGVSTKMSIPKDSKGSLTLIQRFLVLQVYVPKGMDFSIEIGISDMSSQKRRLVLSTTQKETQTNPLHSKIPLGFIKKSKWLNLCLDLLSLVNETWHNQTYKCIDSLSIAGNCRLRRIFTMRGQPPDTTDDEELYGFSGTNDNVDIDTVPKQCQLVPDVQQDVQVVKMNKVRYFEGRGRPVDSATSRTGPETTDLNSSGGKKASSQDSYHIAFGTKMSGNQPRKGSGKEGSSTSRQSKSSHGMKPDGSGDGSMSSRAPNPPRSDRSQESSRKDKPGSGSSSRRERKNSDPGTNTEDPELTVDKESLRTSHTWTDGADNKESIPYVKPHPPRQPSSEKRRRPRVKSAGKERTPHAFSKGESSTSLNSISSSAQSSLNSSNSQSCSNSGSRSTRHDSGNYEQPNIVANDDELERFMKEIHEGAMRETESEPSSHNTSEHNEEIDSISEVIQVLNHHNLDDGETPEYEDSDGEAETSRPRNDHRRKQKIYTFSSKPTAPKRGNTSHHGHSTASTSRKFKQTTTKAHRPKSKKNLSDSADDHRHELFSRRPLGPSGDTIRLFLVSSDEEDEDEERSQLTPRPSQTSSKHRRPSPRKHDSGPQFSKAKHSSIPEPAFTHSGGLLQVAPIPTKSPHSSQTRMSVNRKSLREIPKEELRKSGGQKPYNSTKYQMVDLSDSFEARMLESMRREQLEGGSSSDEGDNPRTQQQHQQCRELDSLSGSSDETEMSTLKNAPQPNAHNYQDEMKILSQEFLTQSNPRDWGNVFSPPIVVPSMQNGATDALTATKFNVSPKPEPKHHRDVNDSDGDGELDLLYDPVLNCYYDPKSCKYYELV